MGGLFNPNGKVFKLLEKVADIMIGGLLWLAFSIPLFTIGAASTALYHVMQKVVRSATGSMWKEFWSAFKSNFKQATILWIILLLIVAFLGADIYLAYIMSDVFTTLRWVVVILIIALSFVVMWSLYWFPYISHIEDTIRAVMRNTFIMCLTNFLKSVTLFAMLVISFLIIIFSTKQPWFFLIMPGIYTYFSCGIFKKVFGQYWDMDDNTTDTPAT